MKTNPHLHPQHRMAGFTLIELMIVVIIIGVLTSIAVPTYRDYVRRGQLAEAFTTLSDLRVKMEQYYQDNKFYGTNSGSNTCATLAPTYGAFPVATKNFNVICAAGAAPSQTYTLTAQGTGGLTTGYEYTLTERGLKSTTKFATATVTSACWLTKAGSCDN